MDVRGLHHVSVGIPRDQVDAARDFYGRLLGLLEIPIPDPIRPQVALWYTLGEGEMGQIHLFYDDAPPAPGARHFALAVGDLDALRQRCAEEGVPVEEVARFTNWERFMVRDPAGNRIEIMQLPREG